jgi:hypothetical protein
MRNSLLTLLIIGIAANSSATIINIPADYPTIQQGIDASADGDTVLVQPGTYVENVNFNGHNIVLGSLFLTTGDEGFITATIIDGNELPVINVTDVGGNSGSITGFSIQHGLWGIECHNSNLLISNNWVLENVDFSHPDTTQINGGILCENSNIDMFSNSIYLNGKWGIVGKNSNLTITDNYVTYNSNIIHSDAISTGGIMADSSNVTISLNNISSNGGWGISCQNSEAIISDNNITDNVNYADAWWVEGGGINCDNTEAIITSNYIANNGAICDSPDPHTVMAYGITGTSQLQIINNNIIRTVFASTIFYNEAYGILTQNSPILINNIVIGVNAGPTIWDFAYGIACDSCVVVNSIVRNNKINFSNGMTQARYSNIEGGWPGEGNIDEDPQIAWNPFDPGHLMSIGCGFQIDSPCIDAGDPAILDSLLDCSWGLGGPRSDMGAFGGGDSASVGIWGGNSPLPERYLMIRNYPNPFNQNTTIEFDLPVYCFTTIDIYDVLGREVENLLSEIKPPGSYFIKWEAGDRASGIYFYKLEACGHTRIGKMVLLR